MIYVLREQKRPKNLKSTMETSPNVLMTEGASKSSHCKIAFRSKGKCKHVNIPMSINPKPANCEEMSGEE